MSLLRVTLLGLLLLAAFAPVFFSMSTLVLDVAPVLLDLCDTYGRGMPQRAVSASSAIAVTVTVAAAAGVVRQRERPLLARQA